MVTKSLGLTRLNPRSRRQLCWSLQTLVPVTARSLAFPKMPLYFMPPCKCPMPKTSCRQSWASFSHVHKVRCMAFAPSWLIFPLQIPKLLWLCFCYYWPDLFSSKIFFLGQCPVLGTAWERSCEGRVEKVHDIEVFMRVNSRKEHLFLSCSSNALKTRA